MEVCLHNSDTRNIFTYNFVAKSVLYIYRYFVFINNDFHIFLGGNKNNRGYVQRCNCRPVKPLECLHTYKEILISLRVSREQENVTAFSFISLLYEEW